MKTARYLAAVRAKTAGNWMYEDTEYLRSDWKADSSHGDTQLGYFDWVLHNLESHKEPEAPVFKCPHCKKRSDYIVVFSECSQKLNLTSNDWTDTEVASECLRGLCMECGATLSKSVIMKALKKMENNDK
jgi:hypothetical protein